MHHQLHLVDPPRRRPRQRGAAALTAVLLLFLTVSLAAAYTGRNLVFEQRAALNQVRSTQAFEAAEAGLEWALAMLNSGRIGADCLPGNAGDTSFRQRYLDIDATQGRVTPVGTLAGDGGSDIWPGCVFNGSDWTCGCPTAGAASLAAPAGNGVFPAFRVRFLRVPFPGTGTPPGLIRIEVNGCTRLDDACLNFPSNAVLREGRATLSMIGALKTGLPRSAGGASPLAAALTVRGDLDLDASGLLTVANAEVARGGATVQTGGRIVNPGQLLPLTVAGSPAADSLIEDDPALAVLAAAPPLLPTVADRLFGLHFALARRDYLEQPALLPLDCPPDGCTGASVRALATLHPDAIIHVRGDLIVATGDVGSDAEPMLLLLDGDLDLQAPSARIHGFVYGQSATTTISGEGTVRGALMAEGALRSLGHPTVRFDAAILRHLQTHSGSFVRVPGSWRDFP